MEGQDENSEVILLLANSQFTLNKELLIKQSKYFDVLLSTKYIDHLKKEHVISDDISISTLEDYISWINDKNCCKKYGHKCKKILLDKYWNCTSAKNLIKLLHLSIFFATDQLTEEITFIMEAIIKRWRPGDIITIWLTASDLGIRTLRDIYFAECLDFFYRLPINELIHLESHNLQKLLNNKNISCTEEHMAYVLFEWKIANGLIELPIHIQHKEPRILHCIVDYDEADGNVNNEILLNCWDGTKFFTHSILTYPEQITNKVKEIELQYNISEKPSEKILLRGVMFIGRKYDVYLCGGDYYKIRMVNNEEKSWKKVEGNEIIWRYSLISKKWYFETNMPRSKRNMLTVCENDKLYFIGGLKIIEHKVVDVSTVDIYDVHMQIWFQGSPVPELNYTTLVLYSLCYVSNNKIIILPYYNNIHKILIYYIKKSIWKIYEFDIGKSTQNFYRGVLMKFNTSVPSFAVAHDKGTKCKDINNKELVVRYAMYQSDSKKCKKNKNYECEMISLSQMKGHNQCMLNGHVTNSYITDIMQTYVVKKRSGCKGDCRYRYACILFTDEIRISNQIYQKFHMHTIKLNSVQWKQFRIQGIPEPRHFSLMDAADLYSE